MLWFQGSGDVQAATPKVSSSSSTCFTPARRRQSGGREGTRVCRKWHERRGDASRKQLAEALNAPEAPLGREGRKTGEMQSDRVVRKRLWGGRGGRGPVVLTSSTTPPYQDTFMPHQPECTPAYEKIETGTVSGACSAIDLRAASATRAFTFNLFSQMLLYRRFFFLHF